MDREVKNADNVGENPDQTSEEITKIFDDTSTMPTFSVELDIFMDIPTGVKKIRGKTKIYGWYPYEFFITEAPMFDERDMEIKAGSMITVRYLLNGVIYGFNTILIRKIFTPKKLWLLQYPDIIESKALRKYTRLQALIPVTINDNQQEGLIMDLSMGGAMIGGELKYSAGDNLKLSFALPTGNTVNGLEAVVKNVNRTEMMGHIGVQFSDSNQEALTTIREFIQSLPYTNTSLH